MYLEGIMNSRVLWLALLGSLALFIVTGLFLFQLGFSSKIAPTPTSPAALNIATQPSLQEEEHPGNTEPEQVSEPTPTVVFEPPVPSQGGTCIEGFIIDRYHQAVGANWKVTIKAEDGTTFSQQADSQGHFRFASLPGGTWTVELQIPQGWRPFTPASFQVTLSGSGDQCAQVRFKVEALACIEATKLDVKGFPGSSKGIGIPGWQITVSDGHTTLTATTDSEGKCRFENLAPGTWTVEEEQKSGWMPVAGYPSRRTITLHSPRTPGVCEKVTFVNQQVHYACIVACKQDNTGNPLPGWKMTIRRVDGTWPEVSQITGKTGCTTFANLALGKWAVQESTQRWWHPVSPTSQEVNLTEPGRCERVTFVNEPLGCIDGYKINQWNQGLPGWTIVAQNKETKEKFTALTDASGYFRFEGLKLGTWVISEVQQPGWEAVTPPEQEVTLTEPFKCKSIRFKNKTEFACVDVFKKDAYDGSGLPGWSITIQPAFGGEAITGVTDGTGHIRFNKLTPGIYIISEETKEGWTPVTPQSVRVTLEATGFCKVVTFKNMETDPPGGGGKLGGGCRAIYLVRWGDTLSSIAMRYGTTVAALKRANGLYSDFIWAGQRLCIP